jgi:hypothetical protein
MLRLFLPAQSSIWDESRVDFVLEDFMETAEYCHVCAALHKHSLCESGASSWSLCYDAESRMFVLYSHTSTVNYESRFPMLEFLPATKKDGLPAVELYKRYHGLGQSVVPISPDRTDRNTSDQASLNQIRFWLQQCEETHQLCQQVRGGPATPFFLPTRLIDIREQPKLIETKEGGIRHRKVRYATLSHRWLPGNNAKLLCSNLEAAKMAIDPSLLTPVFLDSIATAKRLGLDYIWVDALCIIQDDTEDWRRESSLMGLVYSNAYCNFGASAAAEPRLGYGPLISDRGRIGEGIFSTRSPSDLPVLYVNISWQGTTKPYYGIPHFVRAYLDDLPLLKRGWVFQERLLSPCSIYFGKQLSWECSELLASEIFPQGSPGARSTCPWNSNAPVRLFNLITQRSIKESIYAGNIRINELYRIWLNLMRTFRTCRLTFESDVFPAIAGLAEAFQAQLRDEYLAGLWRGDMIRGLLWHVHSWPRGTTERTLPRAYKGSLPISICVRTLQLTQTHSTVVVMGKPSHTRYYLGHCRRHN